MTTQNIDLYLHKSREFAVIQPLGTRPYYVLKVSSIENTIKNTSNALIVHERHDISECLYYCHNEKSTITQFPSLSLYFSAPPSFTAKVSHTL